jgi:disulfide oxidoreductase YuzD
MGDWIPDNKKTSSQLLSQIHLCRFFYKLIERMEHIGEGAQRLKDLMRAIISGKLSDLKNLKVINPRYATIYRRSK